MAGAAKQLYRKSSLASAASYPTACVLCVKLPAACSRSIEQTTASSSLMISGSQCAPQDAWRRFGTSPGANMLRIMGRKVISFTSPSRSNSHADALRTTVENIIYSRLISIRDKECRAHKACCPYIVPPFADDKPRAGRGFATRKEIGGTPSPGLVQVSNGLPWLRPR